MSAPGASLQTGDLARRVARRRAELGKSVEQVASAVGIDPGYLRYFEESPGVRLSTGTMLLLALVLECTPEELYGAKVDRPPGLGRAGLHPELRELTAQQCAVHLHSGGVGRVVLMMERGPVAHPLNFAVNEGDVIISTTTAFAARLEAHGAVSFQIDRVDESMGEGWSVLVTGSARRIDDPDELLALADLGLTPWAGGPRHTLVRIHPDEMTGRVIAQAVAPA